MILEWLEANRNWLTPLGSVVVITSAFIALARWYFGLSAQIKQLDNNNEDELTNFRINHFSHFPNEIRTHLPSAASEVTRKDLVALCSEKGAVGIMREQRPGTYELVRDLVSRSKEARTLRIFQCVPLVLLVALGVLVWRLWQT